MLDDHFYQRTNNLTGLLLPLADRNLILPNVAVAELIDYQPSAFDLDTPPWYFRAGDVAEPANSVTEF